MPAYTSENYRRPAKALRLLLTILHNMPMTTAPPPLRPERLWDTLEASAAIGATADGGLRRLALGDADGAMRDLFVRWCEQAGCTVTVDRVGNLFARRAGAEPELAAVAIGSHLDTQVAGGRFDGVLGVLAGLELVRALDDHGVVTRRPIDVISWTNEEGARFRPPMMGSAVFAGALGVEQALATADDDGRTVGEELRRLGYDGTAPVGDRPLDAYLELHIEQGPVLDDDGVDVGIVTGGAAMRAFEIEVEGATAHAGATPMERRSDALAGAARTIVALGEIAAAHGAEAKTAATRLSVWPGLAGIVPGSARVGADLRHATAAGLDAMVAELERACAAAAAATRTAVTARAAYGFGGLAFDAELAGSLRRAADALGLPARQMLSYAGHDAYHLATVCPTAMIFCPCRNGVTHHPDEDVDRRRALAAVAVLQRAVLERAGVLR